MFWPTRAYERVRAVLGQHRFVVLTGPPEMGKTAIARMLALAKLTDGWEALECTRPDQVLEALPRCGQDHADETEGQARRRALMGPRGHRRPANDRARGARELGFTRNDVERVLADL